MRPSEFEAIRPHLQKAIDNIDRWFNRQREMEELGRKNGKLSEAGLLPKVNLHIQTEEENQEALRCFRLPSFIEDAYPWRFSVGRAAVDLRDCGWIKESEAIGEVLSELPTGLLDGSQMDRRRDTIRAGAERIRTILAICLAGLKGKGKKRIRRQSKPREPRPLTAKEVEAVQIVGECKGNIAEAARRLGKDRKTVDEAYKSGLGKLGKEPVKRGTQTLPRDRRGQTYLAADDDRRE
jgi:hypothetical protein